MDPKRCNELRVKATAKAQGHEVEAASAGNRANAAASAASTTTSGGAGGRRGGSWGAGPGPVKGWARGEAGPVGVGRTDSLGDASAPFGALNGEGGVGIPADVAVAERPAAPALRSGRKDRRRGRDPGRAPDPVPPYDVVRDIQGRSREVRGRVRRPVRGPSA
ncbi:hypothetical protein HEK616_14810 [Streptomyces nigrescens]|uniref:Uncharacterized protein n=1 Tax=Streptomyces nigrescens TaxID=1920 RepID=A0ABN6QP89_STRNI|nr:hypothetical protein HEK616_14810 [Streptomyces nigrescens]